MLEQKVAIVDANLAGLERQLEEAEIELDNAEHYSQRACLRIYRIAPAKIGNESSEDCNSKLKEVFEEIRVGIAK